MRAFIAIEISDAIKDVLGRVITHLKYSGADVKWVDPGIIHLTLKFLGEITDDKRDDIKSSLDTLAKDVKPFEMTIKDLGAFPAIERPRVIWVGLDKGSLEATDLALRIKDSLSEAGFPGSDRPFSAHLTIGRVRSPLNSDKLKDKVSSASSIIQSAGAVSHKVSSVILFQSTLTSHGAIHTKLHESALKGH
ncbi:MAG: RNA 2',3'-cyclic phosphodiesterase [Candidatus Omnitrophica bacterium]|nr:RNA 2',3'-cyclic phosphodiesterase [Candidatus Omnitrophota bacterium]